MCWLNFLCFFDPPSSGTVHLSQHQAGQESAIAPEIGWLRAIRHNHAAEHATIAILSRRLDLYGRLGGRAGLNGFYIFGPATPNDIEIAAREAVDRLRHGEDSLAVSPFCGTNFLLAGALTALGVAVVLGRGNRLQRLPQATAVGVVTLLASFRLGGEVQRRWTTLPAVEGLHIERVVQHRGGRHAVHWVTTRYQQPSLLP